METYKTTVRAQDRFLTLPLPHEIENRNVEILIIVQENNRLPVAETNDEVVWKQAGLHFLGQQLEDDEEDYSNYPLLDKNPDYIPPNEKVMQFQTYSPLLA